MTKEAPEANMTPVWLSPSQHIFPFSLIRYDVMTGEPIRNAQGHCMATSPGLYLGGR